MPGALIVSSGEKGRDMLCGVLTDMGAGDISTVTSGAEARRGFADADWQVILINTPLSDEFGHELAVFAAGSTGAGVVLLVKAEMADEVAARVEDAGVFVVPKPLNRALLFGAVKLAQAANRRIMGLQRQNNILQQKIDDIRLVDRAKCALIQYRLLTEPEAHRYIEREAMEDVYKRQSWVCATTPARAACMRIFTVTAPTPSCRWRPAGSAYTANT